MQKRVYLTRDSRTADVAMRRRGSANWAATDQRGAYVAYRLIGLSGLGPHT